MINFQLADENEIKNAPPLNIFRIVARLPQCIQPWLALIKGLYQTSLDQQDREVAILRQGMLTQSSYEIHQHHLLAKANGLSEELINAILDGDTKKLTEKQQLICQLAEELETFNTASSATLKLLTIYFSEQQILELIITISFYACVGRVANATNIQIENINFLQQKKSPTED